MRDLPGFTRTNFTHEGVERDVYRRGTGPGVLVMHEIPGITPQVATFGLRIADAGFSVFMATLFGTPGRPLSFPYVGQQFARACIRREFRVLAANKPAHSVLTTDLIDEEGEPFRAALDRVLAFLREQLLPSGARPA